MVHMHCTVPSHLFCIIVVICVAFFRQGWDPIGTKTNIALFVNRDLFLQFFPIPQPAFLSGTHPVLRGIAPRPSVVRSTLRFLVNRTLRHGTSNHLHPLSTPRARGPILVRTRPQRGGYPPPPLYRPQNGCTDTMGFVGARDAGDFLLGIRQGEIFLFGPMCLYSKYSEFSGEFKNG